MNFTSSSTVQRARRAALAAVLAAATLGASSATANAAPLEQQVVVCLPTINAVCPVVALPAGLPNIAGPLTATAETVCTSVPRTVLIDQPGTAVALCNREPGALAPLHAFVQLTGVQTYSGHHSGDCTRDGVSALLLLGAGTYPGVAGISSEDC